MSIIVGFTKMTVLAQLANLAKMASVPKIHQRFGQIF